MVRGFPGILQFLRFRETIPPPVAGERCPCPYTLYGLIHRTHLAMQSLFTTSHFLTLPWGEVAPEEALCGGRARSYLRWLGGQSQSRQLVLLDRVRGSAPHRFAVQYSAAARSQYRARYRSSGRMRRSRSTLETPLNNNQSTIRAQGRMRSGRLLDGQPNQLQQEETH